MKQYEAVIKTMEENDGFTTLGYLYQNVLKIKDCEWKWRLYTKSGSPAIYVNQVRKGLPRLIEGTMRPWDNGTIGLFEGLCPWNAFETIKD